MLKTSRSFESNPRRHLRDPEKRLLAQLAGQSKEHALSIDELENLEVQEMCDGGMGSLYIVHPEKKPVDRRFGSEIGKLQFKDTDGMTVIASLNEDQDGDLFELAIWKVDFSPLICLPF